MVIIAFLIATVLGFFAGMGVGGGSLLLIWLTQILNIDPVQAKILNLLFYLPAAFVSGLFQLKHKSIDGKIAVPGLITGCISAAIISITCQSLDTSLMKKLLGGLLIAIGIRELLYRPRNAK